MLNSGLSRHFRDSWQLCTRQVSTLLYCLGEEANDVLTSTYITEEDEKIFSKVMEKFDEFFKVCHNVIFE